MSIKTMKNIKISILVLMHIPSTHAAHLRDTTPNILTQTNDASAQGTLGEYSLLHTSLLNRHEARELVHFIHHNRIVPLEADIENEKTDFTRNRLSTQGFKLALGLSLCWHLAISTYLWLCQEPATSEG